MTKNTIQQGKNYPMLLYNEIKIKDFQKASL